MMLKMFLATSAATVVACAALTAAAAPPSGPTPLEQNGMHTGSTTTNGSAVIVHDQNGTHPEGYPGMAPRNRVSGDGGMPKHHRRHHRRHPAAEPTPG